MSDKVLIKGNEAIGQAALDAGCRHFFGYPITPQTELSEFLAKNMPKVGGVFLQAESEIAAINMVYGAGGAGARVMTSSSSPGISLKQEGISYIAGAEIPAVIVDIMRGGPGLGSIQPGQPDYFQMVKGGGHGDYHNIVLAPGSVQEMYTLTIEAFELADQWRNPVVILSDGALGQMMEPVEFVPPIKQQLSKPWATTGKAGRNRHNIINSLYLQAAPCEEYNLNLQNKYRQIQQQIRKYTSFQAEDAELLIVAYGISARIAQTAVNMARDIGLKVGLFRPISLWPFPDHELMAYAQTAKQLFVLELSSGQMVEDVELAIRCSKPVSFYGRMGGSIPTAKEVFNQLCKVYPGGC